MDLPFTVDEFFGIFRAYNEAVWPAQVLLYALALIVVAAAIRSSRWTRPLTTIVLAFLWLWMGLAYHLTFFRRINPAATVFGAVFVVQAGLFAWTGSRSAPLAFRARSDLRGLVGGLLVLYALVLYPAIGYALGHRYPAMPTFGLPCPTTIFTFGVLLWATPKVPHILLVIPALWALVGSQAVLFGVREDAGLILAAAVATALLLRGRRSEVVAASLAASAAPDSTHWQ